MLSRIAQSLFWIGRYLERADDTARILDVQMQVLIEDPGMDEQTSCEQLLSVMGVEDYAGQPMLLHAQQYVAPLYAKFGFEEFGEPFEEATIMHIGMYRAAK